MLTTTLTVAVPTAAMRSVAMLTVAMLALQVAELDFAASLGEKLRDNEEANNTYSNASVGLTLIGGTVNAPLKPQRFNASVQELFISDLCEWLGCIQSSSLNFKSCVAVQPPAQACIAPTPPHPPSTPPTIYPTPTFLLLGRAPPYASRGAAPPYTTTPSTTPSL